MKITSDVHDKKITFEFPEEYYDLCEKHLHNLSEWIIKKEKEKNKNIQGK